jgi:hypothetical protein
VRHHHPLRAHFQVRHLGGNPPPFPGPLTLRHRNGAHVLWNLLEPLCGSAQPANRQLHRLPSPQADQFVGSRRGELPERIGRPRTVPRSRCRKDTVVPGNGVADPIEENPIASWNRSDASFRGVVFTAATSGRSGKAPATPAYKALARPRRLTSGATTTRSIRTCSSSRLAVHHSPTAPEACTGLGMM